jgi:hypothetical protein
VQIIATLLALGVVITCIYGAVTVNSDLGEQGWVLVDDTVAYGERVSCLKAFISKYKWRLYMPYTYITWSAETLKPIP